MLKDKIKKLINLIEDTEIEEIEVSSFWGAQKIRLSKSKPNQNIILPSEPLSKSESSDIINTGSNPKVVFNDNDDAENVEEKQPTDSGIEEDYSDTSKFQIITAPLVGTFYISPKPEDPPYVTVGDDIEKGMTVCIIEAMKIFNDIESDFSGKLVEIYIENGSPGEYGQELFVLKIDNV